MGEGDPPAGGLGLRLGDGLIEGAGGCQSQGLLTPIFIVASAVLPSLRKTFAFKV